MRARVLFVQPNIKTGFVSLFPFGFGALAAHVKSRRPHIHLALLNRERDISRLQMTLETFKPHVVGISGVSSQWPYIRRTVAHVKEWNPDALVAVGGHHAMLVPRDVLEHSAADAVIHGEGEQAFAEILDRVDQGSRDLDGVPGVWHRHKEALVPGSVSPFIEDLDSLDFVDRGITDFQKIIDENMGTVFFLAGRGCSWSCTFCSNHIYRTRGTGRWTRLRSPAHVLEEMAMLERRYRFRGYLFRDDTFTWDRQWALELCEAYARRFTKPFDIFTRVDCLDPELVDALVQANCRAVWIGIDSGNHFIRNKILRKDMTNDTIIRCCDEMFRKGLTVIATNMVGLPYETPEQFEDTIRLNELIYRGARSFATGSGLGPKCFVFGPFPGTELHRLCSEKGWIDGGRDDAAVYRESFLRMPQFRRRAIERRCRSFRFRVHRRNALGLALAYRLRDSRVGEALYHLAPRSHITYLASRLERLSRAVSPP